MSIFNRRTAEADPAIHHDESSTLKPVPPVQHPVGFDTILGPNCAMEGLLRSNANIRLDGTFTGTLEITGNVLVGETAKITADIHAKNISIAGAVRGNVSGKKVQILRTGRVWGDISATALTTEEGAFIDGKIIMLSHEAARETAVPQQVAETPLEAGEGQPQPPDELEPIAEEAESRGLKPEDVLREEEMASEGGPPAESPAPDQDSSEQES